MRLMMTALTVTVLATNPLFAQDHQGGPDARGYVAGLGGFATSLGNTTGNMAVEGGARIAPHIMAIGNVGRFSNLQGDLQPTLDSATAALAENQGLSVIGAGTLPAWYSTGGLRVDLPTGSRAWPYVLGTMGVARINPTPKFTFSGGTLPDGTTPDVGADVTSTLVSAGDFTAPESSNAFMFTFGGGGQVRVATRWVLDAGYRYSRIAAD